jgi:kynureninase
VTPPNDALDGLRDEATQRDERDPLRSFRDRFVFPQHDGEDVLYFCGNSLGLMPKEARTVLNEELDDWGSLAVEGHFSGRRPWYAYHELFSESVARLVGSKPSEVVVMGGLTNNLHLMMVSFYQPTKERFRIVIEDGAFPSDRYAVQSQARVHGFDPQEAIVYLKPRDGEDLLRTEDVEDFLAREGDSVALVMLGGVNYYTGQLYDLARIAKAAHGAGAKVGYDLAHAAGNVELSLHHWNVDFAVWCTYKYLNAGPGATACAFVHERHGDDPSLSRFAGWWGTDPTTRFNMARDFTPQPGAAGWQLSNAPVMSMAPLRASLDVFDDATLPRLRDKSEALTDYFERCLDALGEGFSLITPRNTRERGCQLSLRIPGDGKAVKDALAARGVVVDFRHPDVIRAAPVPLYNRFMDVWRFVKHLEEIVRA